MTKIKICGLSRMEDIDAVNYALPDYIGFVFAPSRRRIDLETAAELKAKLDNKIKSVGVFVNQDIDFIIKLINLKIIDIAQLHGDEEKNYINKLKLYCGCEVIKSIGIGDNLPELPDESEADYLLFDNLQGGSGIAFSWNIIKNYKKTNYFLAGGLDINNILDAIKLLNPFCVDISGGVETDGAKDFDKIYKFIKKVRDN